MTEIVGRIAVKVVPETDGFKPAVKLAAVKASKGLKVEVPMEVNSTVLRWGAQKAIAETTRHLRETNKAVKIPVTLDTRDLDKLARQAVNEAQRGLKDIVAEIDTSNFERSLDRTKHAVKSVADETKRATDEMGDNLDRQARKIVDATDELNRAAGKDRKVLFTFDIDDDSIKLAKHKVDDFADDVEDKDPEMEVQVRISETAKRYVQAQTAYLTRNRDVDIFPKVNTAALAKAQTAIAALSGGRLIASTLTNLKDLVKNLDKSIPLVGSLAEAAMGLSAWLLAAASNTFALSKALAQIAGAGLALPGLLTGMALGVGATVAVLKDFGKVMPDVVNGFHTLQDTMSDQFWARAKAPMQEMINSLFPEFASGLNDTAAALGGFFATLSNSMQKHLGGKLTPMFDNLAQSIAIGSTGTEAWARIIENLGTTGSEYLPRMAQWVVDISKTFDEWLDAAAEDGRLTGWIDTGITRLKELGTVINGASRTIAGLATAADKAGGSSLKMMGDTLQTVADVVNGPAFQSGLIGILTASHKMMEQISNGSGASFKQLFIDLEAQVERLFPLVGSSLSSLLNGVFTALNNDGLKDGVFDFFTGLDEGIRALEPMWGPLAEGAGALLSVLGEIAANAGPLLAEVLSTVGDLATAIGPDLIQVADTLSGALTDVLSVVALPAVETLISALADLVGWLAQSEALVYALGTAFAAANIAKVVGTAASATGAIASAAGGAGMAKVATALTSIGAAAGPIGLAAAAVAALTVAGTQVGTAAPELNEVRDALYGVVDAAQVGGDAAANASTKFQELFGGDQGAAGILSGANKVKDLGDALYKMAYLNDLVPNPAGYIEWGESLNLLVGGGKAAKNSVEQLDTLLTEIAQSGNAEALAAAQDQVALAIEGTGMTMQDAIELMPNYSMVLREQEAAAAAAAEAEAEAWSMRQDAMTQSTLTLYEQAAVAESLGGVTQSMVQSINDASMAIISFGEAAPEASTSLSEFVSSLEEQIAAQDRFAESMAALAEQGASQQVIDQLAAMGTQGGQYAAQLAEGLEAGSANAQSALNTLEDAAKRATEGALSGEGADFSAFANKVDAAFAQVPGKVEAKMEEVRASVDSKFQELVTIAGQKSTEISTSATTGLEGMSDGFSTASGHAVTGLTNGLYAGVPAASAAGAALGRAASTGYSNAMDIHSPSRVMIGLGKYTTDGLIKGLLENTSGVSDAASSLAESVRAAFTDPESGLGSSEVTKWVNSMTAAFTDQALDAIDAQIDAINDEIDAIRERGDNAKVKKLQKKSDDYEKRIAENDLKISKLGDSEADKKRAAALRKENEQLRAKKKLNDIELKAAQDAQKKKNAADKKALEDKKKALKAEEKLIEKNNDAMAEALRTTIEHYEKELDALQSQWDALNDQLSDAMKQLEDAKQAWTDYAANIKSSIQSAGDWTSLWGELGSKGSKAQTVGNLQAALNTVLEDSQTFADNISNLAGRGVDQSLIDSMIAAGLGDGNSLAAALAGATDEELAALMETWNALGAAGESLGNELADQYYLAGINIAQGLVEGIESEMDHLVNLMGELGEALIAELKRIMGIHSPSREMAKLGKFTGQGYVNGIAKTIGAVRDAAQDLAMPVTLAAGSNARGAYKQAEAAGSSSTTLNYYAAPGSSLGAEEDLFAASDRARFMGWR